MTGGKRKKPVNLDVDFESALSPFPSIDIDDAKLEGFFDIDDAEFEDFPDIDIDNAKTPLLQKTNKPVQLVENEDTGDRLLIYTTNGGTVVEFHYSSDTLWMTQSQMAELFGRDVASISRHIKNIIDDDELNESTSLQKVQRSIGRPLTIYSLDMVISVGYRVSSKQVTLFRKWATAKLVQFATKGFVVDSERLKDAKNYGKVKELREIIRNIRASEANVYREIRTICTMCQDYDGGSQNARNFYAAMQNKLLWATTSHTGPELIIKRANATEENMGLQTWSHTNIRKADTPIAHNYLAPTEIKEKNRMTVMLLDFFEDRLNVGKLTTMAQAESSLNKFIEFHERPLLRNKGSVTRSKADEHATAQYKMFDNKRRALRHEKP